MWKFIRAIAALFAAIVLHGQQLPSHTFLNPSALYAGSGATTLTLSNQGYTAGLTALWNGSPRVTSPGTIGLNSITMALTAADLAAPQLAEITVIDAQS